MLDSRYRLERPLGKGGMAEVWEAYDTQDDHEVAVKVVRLVQDLVGHWFDTENMNQGRMELHNRFRREGRCWPA